VFVFHNTDQNWNFSDAVPDFLRQNRPFFFKNPKKNLKIGKKMTNSAPNEASLAKKQPKRLDFQFFYRNTAGINPFCY
jgi:hypothetical protein